VYLARETDEWCWQNLWGSAIKPTQNQTPRMCMKSFVLEFFRCKVNWFEKNSQNKTRGVFELMIFL
jgi:hypothetical protein